MHIAEDDFYALAALELHGGLFTDAQAAWRQHLGKCPDCYEKYCVYIAMMDLTGCAFLEETEEEESGKEDTVMDDVVLRIQLAGALIASVLTNEQENAPCWNFLRMPKGAARGGNGKGADIFVSCESDYSQIRLEGQKLVIWLDQDVFPAERLGIRYEDGGKTSVCKFSFNEDAECYEAVIDRQGQTDNVTVEIVWL